MGFLKNLFGTRPLEIPLYSPSHPARAQMEAAAAFADAQVELKLLGCLLSVAVEVSDALELSKMIDKTIAAFPENAALHYAKACACILALQGEESETARKQALRFDPGHLDARMKGEHYESWHHLFQFPSWSENRKSLHHIMEEDLNGHRFVQVVRDGLTSGIAMVFPDTGFGDRVKRMRWELRWAKTPHGPIAVHYLIMDWGNNDTRKNEACIPHVTAAPPTVQSSYWVLQRLARLDSCFLVLAQGNRVTRNERFVFPSSLQRTLRQMKKELDVAGPAKNADEVIQKAGKWYMDHTDFDAIQF